MRDYIIIYASFWKDGRGVAALRHEEVKAPSRQSARLKSNTIYPEVILTIVLNPALP